MSETDSKEGNGNGTPQVGALLRASRLRVGEDLRDIADILCIRYIYLEAIEDGRYGDLPGDTYAVGFIRTYSEHLGLDGEEVIRRFKAERAGAKRSNDLSFPTPVPESGMPKAAIVFIGVLLALLVYGGWYVTTTDESILSDLISPVPDHLKHLVDGENSGSTPAPSDGAAAPATDTPAETQNVQTSLTETAEEVANRSAEAAREAAEAASAAVVSATDDAASALQSETPAEMTEAPETTTEATETPETAPSETTEPASSETPSEPNATAAPAETETPAPAVETATTVETAPEPAPVETAATPEPMAATAESTGTTETTPVDPANETAPPVDAEPASEPVVDAAPAEPEPTADELNARSLVDARDTEAAAPTPAPEPEAETESAPVTAPAVPQQTIPSTGTVIRAVETSWVEIRDPANSRILFTGLMSPGETFVVPDLTGLVLDTGNAGGLDVIVDGQSVPKLGDVGAVRKSVSLNTDRLKAGTATSR